VLPLEVLDVPTATSPRRQHVTSEIGIGIGIGRTPVARAFLCVALLSFPAFADEAADIRALLARGDPAAALARADVALAAHPADVPLRFQRGVALMDLGRDAQALAHFERLCEEHPELPDPWNNIALLQVRAGRIEAARAALDNALRADPAHRIARANLGLVHLMLAEAAWQRLVDSGPVDPALGHRLEAVRALLAGARP